MDYVLHFEDGASGYLSHHGVQGQKWGVWNEETRRRYLGGNQSSVLEKGTEMTRFTGTQKKVNLSRPFYASDRPADIETYRRLARYLPSVTQHDRQYRKYSEVHLKAKKDMKVAEGEAVVNYVLKRHGDMTYEDLKANSPHGTGRSLSTVGQLISSRPDLAKMTISEIKAKADTRELTAVGKSCVHDLMSHSVGSFGGNDKSARNRMVEDFKDWGYDAIVDPEDFTSVRKDLQVEHPLLILDPKASIKVGRRKTRRME